MLAIDRMKSVAAVISAALCLLAVSVRAGKYDDLAEYIAHQTASGNQYIADLSSAKSANDVAAALRSSAREQKQIADELVAVLKRHPELRSMPELGLDRQALELWVEANPDADKRRSKAPPEALSLVDAMKRSTSELAAQQKHQQAKQILAQYHGDPAVEAASNELRAVIENNRRRLLNAFL